MGIVALQQRQQVDLIDVLDVEILTYIMAVPNPKPLFSNEDFIFQRWHGMCICWDGRRAIAAQFVH